MAIKPKGGGLAVVVGVGKPKAPAPDDMGDETENPLDTEEATEPAPEEEAEGAYPEFNVPEGLDLSDLEPGEEKEVLCVISKTSDTEACIKQVDGVDLAGQGVGKYGPPPVAPVGPPPPPAGGMPPMGPPPGMMGPGMPIRKRAAAAGLM